MKKNTTADFWARVDVRGPDDCWPWRGSLNEDGYGIFYIAGQTVGAHKMAYLLENGSVEPGNVVRHRCDNRPCCNPAHLLEGTAADNNRDRDVRGRHRALRGADNGMFGKVGLRGEAHGEAKLTLQDVLWLRAEYAYTDKSQRQLAQEVGVSQVRVGCILRGEGWQDIDDGLDDIIRAKLNRNRRG